MTTPGGFWERRKAAVRAEEESERRAEEERLKAREMAELESVPDEEILAKLELPDPDTLEKGDDFSVFMSKAVPDRIRRRALRKLWLSNPVLANLDELVDYGEDFTDAALAVADLQTTYQVGKGMLAHIEAQPGPEGEDSAEETEREARDDMTVASGKQEAENEETESDELAQPGDESNVASVDQPGMPTSEEPDVPIRFKRHMRFSVASERTG